MLVQENLGHWNVSLRELNSAGEPLNPEVIDQVRRAWGLTVRDSYGQTETTMMIGNSPKQKVIAGSMGRPLPGFPIVLLDADGLESDNGEIALPLRTRPAGLMRGYQNEAGEPAPMDGAYFRTGDVATRDAEGYLTFVGRVDDVFKSSDYRLSPFELESALIEHEAVAEAAVVPAPDPVRLAIAKAYVGLAGGSPPSSACAASSSRSCPRPYRARSAGSSCAAARARSRKPASGRRASSGSRIFRRGDPASIRPSARPRWSANPMRSARRSSRLSSCCRKVSRPLANWPKNCANMSVNGFHAYAHPREIEFMERLPRTPSGKLQRFILRN